VARHRTPLTPSTEPAHESAREGSRDNHYRPGSKARASRGGWRPNSGADETMNRDRPGRPGPGVLTPSRGTVGGHHLRSGAWSGDVSAHRRSRVTYLHGGFVDLADLVGPAEIVTLDGVINVYPGWETACLTRGRARQSLFGLVLSARHPRGEAHHCRHESGAPSTDKAGPRVLSFRGCDRADRRRERSHTHVAHDVDPAWPVAVSRGE
jgi:hypothetical protein